MLIVPNGPFVQSCFTKIGPRI